jgi:thiamine phosphate synthase YjbQ (UPF0047 family)
VQEIRLKTDRRTQLVDITKQVQDALGETNGAAAALVYVPHTTAGVTINEGADPAVAAEILVPLDEGKLALGTWQGIFFCEFDGPRDRKVYVTALS